MSQPTNPLQSELQLLEALDNTPETTQVDLARAVGVAVGTVNWHLKRWSKKGFVKISRINRWNWNYLLTSEGIAHKAKLASEYIEVSLKIYRQTREEAKRLLAEIKTAGYIAIYIDGNGEIAEICRLTCLEMEVTCQSFYDGHVPVIQIEQTRLLVQWPITQ